MSERQKISEPLARTSCIDAAKSILIDPNLTLLEIVNRGAEVSMAGQISGPPSRRQSTFVSLRSFLLSGTPNAGLEFDPIRIATAAARGTGTLATMPSSPSVSAALRTAIRPAEYPNAVSEC
jgi:hypothetical protein